MAKRTLDRRLQAFRAYIDLVMERAGLENPTAVARKAELPPSTINRPYHKAVNFAPKLTTLVQIADATGVPLPEELLLTCPPDEATIGYKLSVKDSPGDAIDDFARGCAMEPDEEVAVDILASAPRNRIPALFKEVIKRQKDKAKQSVANPPEAGKTS